MAAGKAKEKIGLTGIDFLQDIRPAAVAMQKAAIHLSGQFINLGLVGLDDNDFMSIIDQRPERTPAS